MTRRLLCTPLVSAMVSLSSAASELAVGGSLPELRGEYLSGRKAVLPRDASGQVALLLFGFTYQSRFAVEAWAKRFREEFEKNVRVTFYEIPMIGGMARLGKWFIDSGMRRGTPKADQEHVITVYGNTQAWKERLGANAPQAACLLLLDRDGKLVWKHNGAFDPIVYGSLSAATNALLANPAP